MKYNLRLLPLSLIALLITLSSCNSGSISNITPTNLSSDVNPDTAYLTITKSPSGDTMYALRNLKQRDGQYSSALYEKLENATTWNQLIINTPVATNAINTVINDISNYKQNIYIGVNSSTTSSSTPIQVPRTTTVYQYTNNIVTGTYGFPTTQTTKLIAANSTNIYIAYGKNIDYQSTQTPSNGNPTISHLPIADSAITSLTADDSYVYFGTSGGKSWICPINRNPVTCNSLGASPNPGGVNALLSVDQYIYNGMKDAGRQKISPGTNEPNIPAPMAVGGGAPDGSEITSLASDNNNNVYAATQNGNIFRSYDRGNGRWQEILTAPSTNNPILSLATDSKGVIYAIDNQGRLYKIQAGRNLMQLISTNSQVMTLSSDNKGSIFAGTSGGGTWQYIDNIKGSPNLASKRIGYDSNNGGVNASAVNNATGTLYVAQKQAGFSPAYGLWYNIGGPAPGGVGSGSIVSLVATQTNTSSAIDTYVIATNENPDGQVYYSKNNSNWQHLGNTTPDGKATVNTIALLDQGMHSGDFLNPTVYVGTSSGKIFSINPTLYSDWNSIPLTSPSTNNAIAAITVPNWTGKENLYAVNYSGYVISQNMNTPIPPPTIHNTNPAIPVPFNGKSLSIAVDQSNNIYISGTLSGGATNSIGSGLYVYNTEASNPSWIHHPIILPNEGLNTLNISRVLIDRNNDIYVSGVFGTNALGYVYKAIPTMAMYSVPLP